MAAIELREMHTVQDQDAAFTVLRESTSSWPRGDLADRTAFDAWIADPGVRPRTIVEAERVVGVAASLDVDGDREILLAVTPSASDDAATEALRLLTVLEPERPLYACVSADDSPSHAVLARLGFVEHARDAGDVVWVLPPTLE